MKIKLLQAHKNSFFFFFFSLSFFFYFFIARDVGGEHENVYNLNILPLKLFMPSEKICMIDDTKKKLTFSQYCYQIILQITQKAFKSV